MTERFIGLNIWPSFRLWTLNNSNNNLWVLTKISLIDYICCSPVILRFIFEFRLLFRRILSIIIKFSAPHQEFYIQVYIQALSTCKHAETCEKRVLTVFFRVLSTVFQFWENFVAKIFLFACLGKGKVQNPIQKFRLNSWKIHSLSLLKIPRMGFKTPDRNLLVSC
jgi:hypothetical protein